MLYLRNSVNLLKIKTCRALCSLYRKMNDNAPLVWIDLEMSGLDFKNDKIMEIACVITDKELNIIAEGPDLVIHQPESVLKGMDSWCQKHHGITGLTEASKKSSITENQAEDEILNFIKLYTKEKQSPLAGNTVYMDRLFLMEYMPNLSQYLHYRLVDVSTIKELCSSWNSEIYEQAPKKVFVHRALSDILESIEELKYYKKFMFQK